MWSLIPFRRSICQPSVGRAGRRESRPVSRVLSRAVIPLGSPSPWTSSGLPGSARGSALRRPLLKDQRGFPIWPCSRWGLPCRRVLPPTRCALTAPFHPCRSRQGLGRSALCCTFRGLAPPRRYLAPDPPEPGLSSILASLHWQEQRLPGRLPGYFTLAERACGALFFSRGVAACAARCGRIGFSS